MYKNRGAIRHHDSHLYSFIIFYPPCLQHSIYTFTNFNRTGGTRTHTVRILSPLPLPIGLPSLKFNGGGRNRTGVFVDSDERLFYESNPCRPPLIRVIGFEPTTSASQMRRATNLRYTLVV